MKNLLLHDMCAANYELCIMNYELIDGYGIPDPGFELLRQVAQKYCPEEFQEQRKAVIPDETLHLDALGLSMASPLPLEGLGEAELRSLHY